MIKKAGVVWAFICSALLVLNLWDWMLRTLVNLTFRYGASYSEPVIAAAVFSIRSFPLLYGNLSEPPFILMPYNPLFAYLSYGVSLLTGENFICGRLVCLLSCLGSLILAYRILRHEAVPRVAAAVACCIPLFLPIILKNTCHMIPGFTALFFGLLGLWAMLRYEGQPEGARSRVLFVLGTAAFALSFFAKQNYVLAAGAYVLYLLMSFQIKRAGLFCLLLAVFAGVPMLVLNAVTGGNYFDHIFFSPATIKFYRFQTFVDYWQTYLSQAWPVVLAALLAVFRLRSTGAPRLFFIYFVCCALSTLILGKAGSGDNYFIEITSVISILAGLAFMPSAGVLFRRLTKVVAALAVLTQLVFVSDSFQFSYKAASQWARNQEKSLDELGPFIRKVKGDILSENMGLLVANGREVVYEPFEYAQLAYLKRFDERIILQKLKNHEYPLIILQTNIIRIAGSSRFTPNFVKAIRQYYRPLAFKHGQFFFIPNPD